ncbi:MAG: UUP1 family membrane protein [Bdellovibrionales bacterium]|nr:UUP1 family membrane protein [Bdellovibrionales bacterium]
MTRSVLLLALVLCTTSLAVLLYRYQKLHTPLLPSTQSSVWKVEAMVELKNKELPVRIRVPVPSEGKRALVVQEAFQSNGLATAIIGKDSERSIVWSGKLPKNQDPVLYYWAVVETGTRYVRQPKNLRSPQKIIHSIVDDEQADRLVQFVKKLKHSTDDDSALVTRIQALFQSRLSNELKFLNKISKSEVLSARLFSAMLRTAGVPSYVGRGFLAVKAEREISPRYWVRAYLKDSWQDIFPQLKEQPDSDQLLFWNYVDINMGKLKKNIGLEQLKFAIAPDATVVHPRALKADEETTFWTFISLDRLPVSMQATYRVLLLVPVGALIVTFFRVVIGLKTFGTFMPILIALSFRETGLFWGIELLGMVVFVGLIIRALLSSLNLLLVSRLAATLSIVILLILAIGRVSQIAEFTQGYTVTLFPIVILTMIIERIMVAWEETGAVNTMMLSFNSLLLAVLSYFAMMQPVIQHIVFNFPESILMIMSVTLLLGRYTYYRLSELFRFRSLAEGA